MKRSELQVGGVYLFSESNTWQPGWPGNRRCVILSLETGWSNRYTWTHYLDQNRVYPASHTQRFPVALEEVEHLPAAGAPGPPAAAQPGRLPGGPPARRGRGGPPMT